MLTHAGKLRLGVVGAVIGGPLVAMRVYVNPLSLTSFDSSPASGGAFWLHHSKLPLHFSASL